MLALDGFDVGVGAGSVLGGTASAEITCLGHNSIFRGLKNKNKLFLVQVVII